MVEGGKTKEKRKKLLYFFLSFFSRIIYLFVYFIVLYLNIINISLYIVLLKINQIKKNVNKVQKKSIGDMALIWRSWLKVAIKTIFRKKKSTKISKSRLGQKLGSSVVKIGNSEFSLGCLESEEDMLPVNLGKKLTVDPRSITWR